MHIFKGFVLIPELARNTPHEISPIGELSADSMTFAKDIGVYSGNDNQVLIYGFHSQTDGESVEAPQNIQTIALAVAQFVRYHALNGGFEGTTPSQARQLIRNHFSDQIDTVSTDGIRGRAVQAPGWVSFNRIGTDDYVRLWFAEEQFNHQYDEYEYEFVAPIANIDNFFARREQVVTELSSVNVQDVTRQIEARRGVHPYTALRTYRYNWVNPNDDDDEIETFWTVIVFGRAGADPDRIRQALANWIVTQSGRDRQRWIELFPAIFVPTEFIITPLWHLFAIPNQTIQAGMNSPVVGIQEALDIAALTCQGIGYDSQSLRNNTSIANSPLTSLSFLATGSNLNRTGITRLRQLHPDYLNVPLSATDFGRMSERTQQWVRLLVDMLQAARDMTQYSTVPAGMSRTIRNGVIYVVNSFDGMQYLVATRESVIEQLGIVEPYEPEDDSA